MTVLPVELKREALNHAVELYGDPPLAPEVIVDAAQKFYAFLKKDLYST